MILDSLLRYDVFISYSGKDKEFVQELVDFLQDRGIRPLWEGSMAPGKRWRAQVEEAIRERVPGIAVLSPEASESVFVQLEWDMLLAQRCQVIPLLYRDGDYGMLQGLHWIDAREPANRLQAFLQVVASLRKKLYGSHRERSNGSRRLSNLSLRKILVSSLFVSVGSVLLASLLVSGFRTFRFKKLQSIQREVQAVDRGLLVSRSQPSKNSEIYINASGAIQGKDLWQEGRLLLRQLYARGRVVATDEFFYSPSSPLPTRKVRSYFDEDQNVFLIDEFAQDGRLLSKRACPEGPERPCELYLDDMQSPMPPPSLFLYR